MNHLQGITLKQFNDAVEEMRKFYDFEDDETVLSSCFDPCKGCIGEVEVTTVDRDTGVRICMSKSIPAPKDPLWNY